MAELQSLGRYTIRRVLGHGAMGIVYEGLDPRLNRRVAIKTILKAQLDEATQRDYSARFVREAQAVAQLSHPHIVQVHDFGQEGDVAYLVMEFIAGKELKSHIDAGERFALKEVVRIVGELCEALDFAHERGIIHRDIKPANVILDASGRVKLADFGVARIQDVGATSASVGGATMVGTPAYMSPEQISGTPVDRRTDVFSAGIVLYQLLTGELPFTGQGAWTIAKKIMQDDPAPPSRVNTAVTPYFDAVVGKALAKSLEERYQTARALGAALREALEGRRVADEDATVIEKLPPLSPPAASSSQEIELEFWRSIKDGNDADDFEAYLEQFPAGIYHKLARSRLARLRKTEDAERAKQAEEQERREAEEAARREAEVKALLAAEKEKHAAELAAQERARLEAEAKARREAEVRALAEAERARREAALAEQHRARAEAEERAQKEAKAREKAEAEKARHEAELRKRQAQPARAGSAPWRWLGLGLVATVALGGGAAAWYVKSNSEKRGLAELNQRLEQAAKRDNELAQAKQREAELVAAAEAARAREEEARRAGDAARQREAAELAKQREEEARRQAEASKQREAELARLRDAEARIQAAQRLAEQQAAEARASLQKAAAEQRAAEEALAQRLAAEKAAAEKAAAEKAAAAREAAERAATERAAAAKPAATAPVVAKASPFPQAGDAWTYRLRLPSGEQRYTVRVTASSSSAVTEVFEIEGGATGQARHGSGAYVSANGVALFSPYLAVFRDLSRSAPLGPIRIEDRLCSGEYVCLAEGRIVGRETVTVPAGTFSAVKIAVEHNWRPLYFNQMASQLMGARDLTIWYVPEMKRAVKFTSKLNAGRYPPVEANFELELASYQLK